MPVQPDIRAIKDEARRLMKSASVSPLRFTLWFLAAQLMLNLISSAADSFLPGGTLGSGVYSLSFATVFVMLLSSVLSAGHVCYCLGVQRGETMPYGSLFDALPFAGKVVLLQLLQGGMIALGLSCFVLPGVVLALAYSQAIYHLCEYPEGGVLAAMRRSRMEMRGRKGRMLLLFLSFWPLFLAAGAALACGFPLMDVFPETAAGNFLYTLACGLLSGSVNAFLLPLLKLSQAGFYRAIRSEAPGAAGTLY